MKISKIQIAIAWLVSVFLAGCAARKTESPPPPPQRSEMENLLAETYRQNDWDHFFGLSFIYFNHAEGEVSERAHILRSLALLRHCRFDSLKKLSDAPSKIHSRKKTRLTKSLEALSALDHQLDLGRPSTSKSPSPFSQEFQWKMSEEAAVFNNWRSVRMNVKSFCSSPAPSTKNSPAHSVDQHDFVQMSEALTAIQDRELDRARNLLTPLYHSRSDYREPAARLLVSLTDNPILKNNVLEFLLMHHKDDRSPEYGRWLFQRGLLLYETKKYAHALPYFDQALTLKFEEGLVNYWKGFTQWNLKHPAQAFALWLAAKEKLASEFHKDLLLDMAEAAASIHPSASNYSAWLLQLTGEERLILWEEILKHSAKPSIHRAWLPLMKIDEALLLLPSFKARDFYFQALSKSEEPEKIIALGIGIENPSPLIAHFVVKNLEFLPLKSWQNLPPQKIKEFLTLFPDQVLWIDALESKVLHPRDIPDSVFADSLALRFAAKSLGNSKTEIQLDEAKPSDASLKKAIQKADEAISEISRLQKMPHEFSAEFLKAFSTWNRAIDTLRSTKKAMPPTLAAAWSRLYGKDLVEAVQVMKTHLAELKLSESDKEAQALFDRQKNSIIKHLNSIL